MNRSTLLAGLAALLLTATACTPADTTAQATGTASTTSTTANTSAPATSPAGTGACTIQITGPTVAGGQLLATVTTTCTGGASAIGAVGFTHAPAGTPVTSLTGWSALPSTGYWNGMPPTANLTAACSPDEWVVVAETQTNHGPARNTESTPVTVTAAQCG